MYKPVATFRINNSHTHSMSFYDHHKHEFIEPIDTNFTFSVMKLSDLDYVRDLIRKHFTIDYVEEYDDLAVGCMLKNNAYVVSLEVWDE
jgi:hypothetical protein